MRLNLMQIRITTIIAYLFIISLPYDSLTYLLNLDPNSTSQTFPVACLFSLIYISTLILLRQNFTAGRLILIPALFFIYLCVITIFNTVIEDFIYIEDINKELRISSAIRQGASFFLGLLLFYTCCDIFKKISNEKIQLIVIISTIPTILICFYQIFMGEFRAQGFSSEPSHLADYLVWIFLPSCYMSNLSRIFKFSLYIIGLTLLFFTFSITGYLKLLSIIIFILLYKNKNKFISILITMLFFLLVTYIIFNSGNNYVSIMLASIIDAINGYGNIIAIASITDRFFGFVGPFNMLGTLGSFFGFGYGADSVYFSRMFSSGVAEVILSTKGDLPSLSSLQGKMFLYGGVFGYLVYLSFWYKSWRLSNHDNFAKVVIPAIFLCSFFSLGPFFLPYTWYWLAQSLSLNRQLKPRISR